VTVTVAVAVAVAVAQENFDRRTKASTDHS